MAYTKHTWAAGPSGGTPITYTKLNEMETGILAAHTGYASAQSTASNAYTRTTTNATNISSLTTRVTSAEGSLSSLSGDVQYLNADVTDLQTTVGGHTTTLGNHTSSISTINESLGNLSSAVEDHEDRIDALEAGGGGGGGGGASLTLSQFVNTADITIANNAWCTTFRLSNRPGVTNSGDITIVDASTSRTVLQVINTGMYMMSMTVVDTVNPSGQANFLCDAYKVADANASSISRALSRFQHYASNQGSGTAAMQLSAGDYLAFAFRQNATGGSMILPNGVNGVQNNGYVGLTLTYIKVG